MNKYVHQNELVISLANSYYFIQNAYANNLKNLIQLIVSNYGVKANSFVQQSLTDKLKINIGQAVFPSNNVFAGSDYLYDIQLEALDGKQYIIMTHKDVFSNLQPNIYEESNYVLQNPGIIIEQTSDITSFPIFTSMILFEYSAGSAAGVSGAVSYSVVDKRPLLSILYDKQFNLSKQDAENEYYLSDRPYTHFHSPIFYGLEKVSINVDIDYFTSLYAGYFVDLSKDDYTLRSYAVPYWGAVPMTVPMNNICIAPMCNYNLVGTKKSFDNCSDTKEVLISDSSLGFIEPSINGFASLSSNKSPFDVFETTTYYNNYNPARLLLIIQDGGNKTLINTTHSGFLESGSPKFRKFYPLLYNQAQVSAKSFNQYFQLKDTQSTNLYNSEHQSVSRYKAVINCGDCQLDANDAQRWYFTVDEPLNVFTLTTPDTMDGLASYKTYITSIQLVNYSDDTTFGSGPASLFAGGIETEIDVEVAADPATPYEDSWTAEEGEEILISTNGNFTVPFHIVDDLASGEDYMPFKGYIAIDLKFSK